MRNIVVSLFDLTGVMVDPWIDAGYTAYIVDIQHKPGIHEDPKRPGLFKVGADLRNGWLPPRHIINCVAFMASFPECTNTALTGRLRTKALIFGTHYMMNGRMSYTPNQGLLTYHN